MTRVVDQQSEVRIEFRIAEKIPAIPASTVKRLEWDLDIERLELHRTHWALKDVDLFDVLLRNKALGEEDVSLLEAGQGLLGRTRRETNELLVRPSVFRVPSGGQDDRLVAIMMPFDRAFDGVRDAIVNACTELDLKCQRADDIWEDSAIIQDVFALIYRSRIIVADLTDKNANVLYELGIAHTLGRNVIPILQSSADMPFDLRHHRYIKYFDNGEGHKQLTDALKERLRTLYSQCRNADGSEIQSDRGRH